MKFIVSSDNTGGFKEVVCNTGTDTSIKDGKPPISITSYAEGNAYKTRIIKMLNFKNTYLIGARAGGAVSIYDMVEVAGDDNEEQKEAAKDEEEKNIKYQLLHTYQLDVSANDKPVSVIELDALDAVLVAFESCKVFVIHFEGDSFDFAPISVNIPDAKPINAFAENPQVPGVFALGGEENDVRVIRIFDKDLDYKFFQNKKQFEVEVLFTAENVENDYLDMRVPIWIKQIVFLHSEDEEHFRFVTGTKYGQLRIYNTAEDSEPVHDYKITDKPIISMILANDETQKEVISTDSHNMIAKHHLEKVDKNGRRINSASAGLIIKSVAKLMGKYSEGGNTGAIFALVNGDNKVLATGGLDRYLRVFDIESRRILAKVYVGVEISLIVVLNSKNEKYVPKDGIARKRRRDIAKAEESDDEELWAQLDKKQK